MTPHTTSQPTMPASETREQQLRAIAFLASAIRPDWRTTGIMAALRRRPDADIADLAIAAIWAAANRTEQHTPAVIALDGEHWHITGGNPQPPAPQRLTDQETCGYCYRDQTGHNQANTLVEQHHQHPWVNITDMRRTHTTATRPWRDYQQPNSTKPATPPSGTK